MKILSLGYPRMGKKRELTDQVDLFLKSRCSSDDLLAKAKDVCRSRWDRQIDLGVDLVPVGDFSLFDPVLDTAVATGNSSAEISRRTQSFSRHEKILRPGPGK